MPKGGTGLRGCLQTRFADAITNDTTASASKPIGPPTARQRCFIPVRYRCKYLQRVDVQRDETVDKIFGILAVVTLDVPVYHAPEVFA